jgi:hypothetical protein
MFIIMWVHFVCISIVHVGDFMCMKKNENDYV